MNEGQPGRTGLVGMIGDATGLNIPAVFATFAAGEDSADPRRDRARSPWTMSATSART